MPGKKRKKGKEKKEKVINKIRNHRISIKSPKSLLKVLSRKSERKTED
jgi:hypothetical protein